MTQTTPSSRAPRRAQRPATEPAPIQGPTAQTAPRAPQQSAPQQSAPQQSAARSEQAPARRRAVTPAPAPAAGPTAPVAPARTQPTQPATAGTGTTESSASFADLGLPAALIAALEAGGITSPFPIQVATLPDTLAGRDVLGRGRTGSGKTLAFALPLVARLAGSTAKRRPGHPRGLVLAPTRELASQISATVEPLATAAGLRMTTVFGGVPQGRQVTALNAGVDILVATPGRLEDLKSQGLIHLDAVEVTVLDEADHMADLGFLPAVKRLLDATPTIGQRMLFSATLDNGVDILVRRYLTKPLTHSVDSASSPVAAMTHHIFEVSGVAEKADLVQLLASGSSRRLLFTRTKHQARKLARQLTEAGIPAADLHGNLSQNARERNLGAFASGQLRVLVATDIAARGIHVDDVELVVHVDPPTEHKAYLHRSGRTARAGSGGDVVTIVLPEQRSDVRQLTRAAKITASPQLVTATSGAVSALVGSVAPYVAPGDAPEGAATKPAPQAPSQNRGRARAGGGGGLGGGSRGNGSRAGASAGSAERGVVGARAGGGRSPSGTRAGGGTRAAAGGGRAGGQSGRTRSGHR